MARHHQQYWRWSWIAVYALCAVAVLPRLAGAAAGRGCRIYLVRHAQTISNVTGDYRGGNADTFTEEGRRQVETLTRELLALPVDGVAVSPLERAMATVVPYLEKTGRKAEVWPELEECCWQEDRSAPPTPGLHRGRPIVIPEAFAPCIVLRNPFANFRCGSVAYADGIAQVRRAAQLIRKRFFGTGTGLIIVTHGEAGSRIIELLLGIEPAGGFWVKNALISRLVEAPDGTVRLETLNGEPAPSPLPAVAPD